MIQQCLRIRLNPILDHLYINVVTVLFLLSFEFVLQCFPLEFLEFFYLLSDDSLHLLYVGFQLYYCFVFVYLLSLLRLRSLLRVFFELVKTVLTILLLGFCLLFFLSQLLYLDFKTLYPCFLSSDRFWNSIWLLLLLSRLLVELTRQLIHFGFVLCFAELWLWLLHILHAQLDFFDSGWPCILENFPEFLPNPVSILLYLVQQRFFIIQRAILGLVNCLWDCFFLGMSLLKDVVKLISQPVHELRVYFFEIRHFYRRSLFLNHLVWFVRLKPFVFL